MKKAIFGAGGFARELFYHMKYDGFCDIDFFVDDAFATGNVNPISKFNPLDTEIIVAVGNPIIRKSIVDRLPKETKYFTYISKSAKILDETITIGDGSIICSNSVLTTNIKIGKHAHLNLSTTIGHDVIIGDYFTTAPGVHVSGNCCIGDNVYIGTNGSIKEKIKIQSNAVIGLNGGIVKNIDESGVYVGCPGIKIK